MNARSKTPVPPTESPPDRPRTQHSISLPLLLGTAVVLGGLAVFSFFWHRYQVDRLAPELLEQARLLEAEGRLLESTQRIYQYLQIRPDDPQARIALALTYDALATDINRQLRAIELYTEAIRGAAETEKPELNRRLGTLLLQVARVQMQVLDTATEMLRREIESRLLAAMHVAIEVIEQDNQDPEGWRILAWALLGCHQLENLDRLPPVVSSVGAAFQRAVERNPADTQLAIQLAHLYRNRVDLLEDSTRELPANELARLADAAVDQAVAANAQDADAYLYRADYRSVYGIEGVRDDLNTAFRLAPENVNVHVALAVHTERQAAQLPDDQAWLERRPLRERAIGHLQQAVELAPTNVPAYLLLGQLHRQQDQPAQAIRVLEQGLERTGGQNLQVNALLAELLLDQRDETLWKRIADQIARYDEAVRQLRPMLSEVYRRQLEQNGDILRARLMVQRREFPAALKVLEPLLADPAALAVPLQIVVWRLREQAHAELLQWEPAAHAAEQLVRLQPDEGRPRIRAAINWLAAERLEVAAQHIGQLSGTLEPQEVLDARLLLAAASLEQQRRLPPDQQQWQFFRENLAYLTQAHTKQPIPRSWRLALLQAGYHQTANPSPDNQSTQAALEPLRQAEVDYPEDVVCLQQLAEFYGQNGAARDVQRIRIKLKWLEALQQGHGTAAEDCEQQLQAYEDTPPAYWQYYRARRLLDQTAGPVDARLEEASQLHARTIAAYPQAKSAAVLPALLHDARGEVGQAIAAYEAAWQTGARDPNVLERLVVLLAQTSRQLLDDGAADEAQVYVERLTELTPNAPGTKQLEIRWLQARQRAAEVPAVIENYQRYLQETLTGENSAAAIQSIIGQLYMLAGDYSRAEPLLAAALDTHGDDRELLETLATLRLVQHRNAEAIPLYRHLLELTPENPHPGVLNNLAVALSESPETRAEAFGIIGQAIEIAGQIPALLDTKATILLLEGRNEEAARLLEEAVASSPQPRPVHQLHLAVAYARTGRDNLARETLAAAQATGLENDTLTASDHEMLKKLEPNTPSPTPDP